MRDRKLNRLFARWRARGDGDALGQVFDRTAPEISRIALHLVRDPAEADDLLQATFLTAIERAASFDASEPLVPWLVGILVRHAHEARRKRERTPDPGRLGERREPEPHEAAEAAEVSAALRQAVERLSARDREVLIPFLYEGKRAVEIAAQTGRPAGTVRMQLQRGLDRLRDALPAGLSLGAIALLGGRGLAAVRAEVLRQAALSTPIAAGAGAGLAATWTLGGLIVTKKLALGALALAVALGIGWWVRATSSTPVAGAPAQPVASLAPLAPEEPEIVPVPSDVGAPATGEARSEVAAGTRAAERDATLVEGLAGITGRLVRASGEPAADVPVSLLEMRAWSFTYSLDEVFDRPQPELEIEVSRARTDGNGRFRLGRARALGLHGLGIDLGGPCGSLRAIDRSLRPGEDVDLGDIALNATLVLAGRVVDENSAPLAGVRVRAAAISQDTLEVVRVLAPFQPRSLLMAVGEPGVAEVIEFPAWADALLERLPVSTDHSDEKGQFELAVAVSADTQVAALFDARGRPNRLQEVGPAAREATLHLGDVVLGQGLQVRGRVVDASGSPVPGSEVAVGSAPVGDATPGTVVFAPRAGVTDASGRFASSALPPSPVAFVAVRAPSSPAWTVVPWLPTEGEIEVRLPPTSVLRLSAHDQSGAPVEEVELSIASDPLAPVPGVFPLGKLTRLSTTRSESEPGVLELRDLPYGTHLIVGRAPSFACASTRVNLQEPKTQGELVFVRAGTVTVDVRDRATKQPVRGAQVSVHEGPVRAMVARAFTDGIGTAVLAGVPRGSATALTLVVEHAGFATLAGIALSKDLDRVEVELDVGGELLARVREGEKVPSTPVLLLVMSSQGAIYERNFPLLGASDQNGDVSMLRLSPGDYHYTLMRSTLGVEIGALGEGFYPLAQGRFAIEAGRTTELAIDPRKVASVPAGTARVRGRITVNGSPAAGWLVTAGRKEKATTDLAGNFELVAVPFWAASLTVQRREEHGWNAVKMIELHLEPGADEFIEVELQISRVRVEVRDQAGRPVPGASVAANADPNTGVYWTIESDASGVASLDAIGSGRIRVEARHHEIGWGVVELDRDGTPEQNVVVSLEPAVPCSGRLLLPDSVAGGDISDVRLYLRPRNRDSGLLGESTCDQDHQGWTFQVRGCPAGEYSAYFSAGRTQLGPIPFDLPKEGRTDAVLDFTTTR